MKWGTIFIVSLEMILIIALIIVSLQYKAMNEKDVCELCQEEYGKTCYYPIGGSAYDPNTNTTSPWGFNFKIENFSNEETK